MRGVKYRPFKIPRVWLPRLGVAKYTVVIDVSSKHANGGAASATTNRYKDRFVSRPFRYWLPQNNVRNYHLAQAVSAGGPLAHASAEAVRRFEFNETSVRR
jgi:hypothetical protein